MRPLPLFTLLATFLLLLFFTAPSAAHAQPAADVSASAQEHSPATPPPGGPAAKSPQPSVTPSPLPPANSYESIGWLLAGLLFLMGILNTGFDLFKKFFPAANPPLHQVYATKEEIAALQDAIAEEMEQLSDSVDATTRRIEDRFEKWLESMDQDHKSSGSEFHDWQLNIERAVGSLQAKVEVIAKPRR